MNVCRISSVVFLCASTGQTLIDTRSTWLKGLIEKHKVVHGLTPMSIVIHPGPLHIHLLECMSISL